MCTHSDRLGPVSRGPSSTLRDVPSPTSAAVPGRQLWCFGRSHSQALHFATLYLLLILSIP